MHGNVGEEKTVYVQATHANVIYFEIRDAAYKAGNDSKKKVIKVEHYKLVDAKAGWLALLRFKNATHLMHRLIR